MFIPSSPRQALDVDLCDVLEFRALHEGLKKMTHFKPQVRGSTIWHLVLWGF